MDELKNHYEKIVKQRKTIIEEINNLEKNDEIKRYLQLRKKNENLAQEQDDILRKIKYENYKSCSHIFVYSRIDIEYEEGRTNKICGCIKCGLENDVLNFGKKYLSLSRQVMYDYLQEKHRFLDGIKTDIVCDLQLAQSIYSKIKENNPDIDDETAIKYFEIALDNIRNIKVNNDRKTSRAKRLSLGSSFKRWDSVDVRTN